jgi:hypothetical protein
VLDRDAERVRQTDDDTALRGAVELREHQSRDVRDLGEELRLGDRVLTRVRIEHQQRLVGCPVEIATDHPVHLAELFHQRLLGLQAARRVDDGHVHLARDCGLHRVEGDGRGVAAIGPGDDVTAHTIAPGLELLARSRAKRVPRTEQHLVPRGAVLRSQLADRRGLARAVDAEHQDDMGLARERKRASGLHPAQLLENGVPQHLSHRRGALARGVATHALEQTLGRLHAEIGAEQHHLELFEHLRVQAATAQHAGQAPDEGLLGALEAIPQPNRRRLGGRGRDRLRQRLGGRGRDRLRQRLGGRGRDRLRQRHALGNRLGDRLRRDLGRFGPGRSRRGLGRRARLALIPLVLAGRAAEPLPDQQAQERRDRGDQDQ